MAGWRRAIELAMTAEEIGNSTVISRSRSEAARRVERAQILLAYRQEPSFFAVGGTNVSPIWSRARCARSSAKVGSDRLL